MIHINKKNIVVLLREAKMLDALMPPVADTSDPAKSRSIPMNMTITKLRPIDIARRSVTSRS
jgi:hypothetical protein